MRQSRCGVVVFLKPLDALGASSERPSVNCFPALVKGASHIGVGRSSDI